MTRSDGRRARRALPADHDVRRAQLLLYMQGLLSMRSEVVAMTINPIAREQVSGNSPIRYEASEYLIRQ